MENCSNVANIPFTLKVGDEHYVSWFLTQFDETFEIVDKNKTHCKGVSSCKRIYDFNGNEIGDPKPFKIQNNAAYYPVSRESSDKGYYALLRKVAQSRKVKIQLIYEVQHVDASGNSRKLLTMPQEYDFRVFTFSDDMAVNVRNELCTICGRHFNDSRDLRCLQFDTQGMKLNVTMEMPTYGKKLAIYNLAGGGILVVFGFCYKVDNIVITSWLELVKCSEFQIQRIGANGHMFSPLIIDGFDETDLFKLSRFHMHITENDHNEFCLTSVGPMQPSNISTSVYEVLYYKWCIPEEWTVKN
ncbi:hypothetical protein TSAR_015989 [Trichomalopsis sarcophagae]|uniref:Uncharacterized protein n=1 Tax=Trichomalopsis sarcophagae TaxID=543379 RepID=A0A232EL25_9HYME|nr:hypothetical protein TSAR_015989 [Trichomalopsis sarcophagae]